MKIETFDSVWDAVSAPPEQAENMRIRAELVTIINNWIEQQGFSQAQAASALGSLNLAYLNLPEVRSRSLVSIN